MLFTIPHIKKYHRLVAFLAAVVVAMIFNPYTPLDSILLITALLISGHILLQEKLLLVFLIIRPLIDIWRDVPMMHYKNTSINLNAIIAIMFLLWALVIIARHTRAIQTAPLAILLPLIILLMASSAFYSVLPFTTIIETIKFADIVALFFLSYIFMKERRIALKEFLCATVFAAVIPLGAGIFQLVTGSGMDTFGIHGRIFGTFAHPNIFAFFIIFLIFLLIHFTVIDPSRFSKQHRTAIKTAMVILIILLIATYTRAAWIGLAMFLMIIGLLRYNKILAYCAGGIIIVWLIAYPFNIQLSKKMNDTIQSIPLINRLTHRNEDADSFAWRLTLLRETAPLRYAKPWFGYGYGTFEHIWEENRSAMREFDDSAESHNDYLRLLLETGIVGLMVYSAVLLRMLQLSAWPFMREDGKKNEYIYLFAWVITFIVVSVSDNMLHHTPVMWLMWSWWGVLLAYYKKYDIAPNFVRK